MKTTVSPYTVAFLILGTIAPLSAQNLVSNHCRPTASLEADAFPAADQPRFRCSSPLTEAFEVPALENVEGTLPQEDTVYQSQGLLSLGESRAPARKLDAVADLDILRQPSPYQRVLVNTTTKPYEIEAGSLETGLQQISAIYREAGTRDESASCESVALSAGQSIKLDPARLLEIVELEISANPSCACEIVKAAISAGASEPSQTVAIVETAILAAPDSMRIVSQCAIAAMPESISAVQSLLTRLDPNAGEASPSAKSAKSAKALITDVEPAALPNPLDLPPSGPPLTPLPIIPPVVTDVNPGRPSF